MYQITAVVRGMICGMCEAHVQDSIRKAFEVKKVKASKKKQTVEIFSEVPISEEQLREVIAFTGYEFVSSECKTFKPFKLFGNK